MSYDLEIYVDGYESLEALVASLDRWLDSEVLPVVDVQDDGQRVRALREQDLTGVEQVAYQWLGPRVGLLLEEADHSYSDEHPFHHYRYRLDIWGTEIERQSLSRHLFRELRRAGGARAMLVDSQLGIEEEFVPDPAPPLNYYPPRDVSADVFVSVALGTPAFVEVIQGQTGLPLRYVEKDLEAVAFRNRQPGRTKESPGFFEYHDEDVQILVHDDHGMGDSYFLDPAPDAYLRDYRFQVRVFGISRDWTVRAQLRDEMARRIFEAWKQRGDCRALLMYDIFTKLDEFNDAGDGEEQL